MSRWPVRRQWSFDNDPRHALATSEGLLPFRGACLLGSAGLGKTSEFSYLDEIERKSGRDVVNVRAAALAHSAEALVRGLDRLTSTATSNTTIYIDALDEAMVPVRQSGPIITAWLRDRVRDTHAQVRLSCRSAVFPDEIRSAMAEIYGADAVVMATLKPLTLDDVRAVAIHVGVDARTFVESIERSRAEPLASQPLTLSMLLRVFERTGRLPRNRGQLFEQGVQLLATERAERVEDGTAIEVPVNELIECAERLSCFILLSGLEVVDYSDLRPDGMLSVHDLAGLPAAGRRLEALTLRALRNSALCEREGPTSFRMAHRQVAEYLAGRRLATLLPHQVKALLASPLGTDAGVSGPLRETAAFVASLSEPIAEWITERDPEVIGLSDVADHTLRRRATLNLLSRMRKHELTDTQLWRGGLEVKGLQYDGAENDLRPILRERDPNSTDVVDAAIWFAHQWKLHRLSEDLADLTLDPSAAPDVRKSAGYALEQCGTDTAKQRLLSLSKGGPDDPDDDFKGIALLCNYPSRIHGAELLHVLTRPHRNTYGGAYFRFLHHLNDGGFDAVDSLVEGVTWARQFFSGHAFDSDPLVRMGRRICRTAARHLDDQPVAAALAETLVHAARQYVLSPIGRSRGDLLVDAEATDDPDPWADQANRRRLIEALVRHHPTDAQLWWAVRELPGFLDEGDLEWATQLAMDTNVAVEERQRYLEWASVLARRARAGAAPAVVVATASTSQVPPARVEVNPLDPRLDELLQKAEAGEPRYFLPISRVLNINATDANRLDFNRFVTRSRGWQAADPVLRNRIVNAAKQLLDNEVDELAETAGLDSLNTIHYGFIDAAWLLLECDRPWLEGLPKSWWKRWAWYCMRECRPHFSDEPNEPKELLLRLVYERAPDEARSAICRLAITPVSDAAALLQDLLKIFKAIPDTRLDEELCEVIANRTVQADRVGPLAEFVLSRDSQRALGACFALITEPPTSSDDLPVAVAVALLSSGAPASLQRVVEFVQRRRDLGSRILGQYATGAQHSGRTFTVADAGRLFELLLEFFPPETDQVHEGAYFAGPDDAARMLRSRLISWLGERSDFETVEELRRLERQLGTRYPWLRRPRASAERAYRLSQVRPLEPSTVAVILDAADKRLVRSSVDVVDGINDALAAYAEILRRTPGELDDFWNRPRGGRPSPKEEERVSEKVSDTVRLYFRSRAVAADREVQIYRRLVSQNFGGDPGSEVDVLVVVPAVGAETGDEIKVPIEVKLAHNPEARTALRAQLYDRYMTELGADCGVYVLVWMEAPGVSKAYSPLWNSLDMAESDLKTQATAIAKETTGMATLRVVVIDATLGPRRPRPPARKQIKKPSQRLTGRGHPTKEPQPRIRKKRRIPNRQQRRQR